MNADLVQRMAQATLAGNLPFLEIVGNLLAEGVEYYRIDYVAKQMSFYGGAGSVVVAPLVFENLPVVAAEFNGPALLDKYFPDIDQLRHAIAHAGANDVRYEEHAPEHGFLLVGFREQDRYTAPYKGTDRQWRKRRADRRTTCGTHAQRRQCGLTLPSSGPAFGDPLTSNVRPLP